MTPLVDTAGRLRRLLAILAWLSQVGEAPVGQLADRFGLTPTELVSELELAACCGLPPYTPDQLMEIVVTDTTVSARPGTALGRPRQLSPEEGLALSASARALLAVAGSDTEGALSSALAKLDRALGGERLEIELDAPPMLPAVQDALTSGSTLAITYYSASTDRQTDREIAPVRIFAAEGHWYVDAISVAAGGERRFRVDRIVRARPAPAQPADSRPAEAADSRPAEGGGARRPATHDREENGPSGFEAFVPGPDTRTVRLSIDSSMAWLLESLPGVDIPRPLAGRMEVAVEVGGDAWLQRLLLRLGPGAEVVEPLDDAELASEAAARILDRYRSVSKNNEK